MIGIILSETRYSLIPTIIEKKGLSPPINLTVQFLSLFRCELGNIGQDHASAPDRRRVASFLLEGVIVRLVTPEAT